MDLPGLREHPGHDDLLGYSRGRSECGRGRNDDEDCTHTRILLPHAAAARDFHALGRIPFRALRLMVRADVTQQVELARAAGIGVVFYRGWLGQRSWAARAGCWAPDAKCLAARALSTGNLAAPSNVSILIVTWRRHVIFEASVWEERTA